MELPTCKGDPALPAMQRAQGSEMETPHLWPSSDGNHQPSLHDLHHETLLIVLSFLGPVDLSSACCSCRLLRAIGTQTILDLKLSLYPHQVTLPTAGCQSTPVLANPRCQYSL